MQKIQVVMTCYNRKEHTVQCINTLVQGNPEIKFAFTVVDDKSSDGTVPALKSMPYPIELLYGTGQLFWNGGMHRGIASVMEQSDYPDYVLLVNDDVSFFAHSIEAMVKQSEKKAVVVGTIVNRNGETSYGGVRLAPGFRVTFLIQEPNDTNNCDTFNANCVLIPYEVLKMTGNLDPKYKHAMGDFDYGLHMKKSGIRMEHTPEYAGQCETNSIVGTWQDTSLSRKERLRLKGTAKGLPASDWFHFINKNFGLCKAVYHTITPYIRILIKK